ncbi:response regulator transcription factor [Lactobacillus sp.]|uniref:LytR/AlgR family response regulator transcription factor n=1 Tax=Lactobacillus sp. TaxID=1591 RepID=UPI00198449BE|nr:response regulator transcription factor [Lactobacillus sp.]MBD5429112.1 response regulator transcription factor [Lactobacillus sp.]MBD5430610.1 response regulator transcription factor [Lactobacillus sp.]
MQQFNIFVCDDNPAYLNEVTDAVKQSTIILSDDQQNFNIFNTKTNYSELLNYISTHKIQNNIYFLDIELQQEKNGLDLAEQIHSIDQNGQIIFVTSHQHFAFLTYQRRINALDYILKNLPATKFQERITETLTQAKDNLLQFSQVEKETFTYNIGSHVYKIPLDNIYYISTIQNSHNLALITKNGSSYFRESIKNIARIYPSLTKVSQSYLINSKNISDINLKHRTITFPNKNIVPYSFRYQKIVKNLI